MIWRPRSGIVRKISRASRWLLRMFSTSSHLQYAPSLYRFCVQTVHWNAVCRCRCHYQSASPLDNCLETDERPSRIGMKIADFHDVLRGPPARMFAIFTLHRVSFLRLSFHICAYGIISSWRIHRCGRPYDFYVKKTLPQLCRMLASIQMTSTSITHFVFRAPVTAIDG